MYLPTCVWQPQLLDLSQISSRPTQPFSHVLKAWEGLGGAIPLGTVGCRVQVIHVLMKALNISTGFSSSVAISLTPCSMRMSLCKIWKSIIKHDITTLQQECNALGVKGELFGHLIVFCSYTFPYLDHLEN